MESIIKFYAEGLVNSFRIPQTAVYQNTELCPKKTHISGLLSNILGKNEEFYYKILLPSIKIGVIPINLEGIFVDLWQFKKWKASNIGGRAVVKREKLFQVNYEIFISLDRPSDATLLKEIYKSLKYPKRPPSLGMDDELIKISHVKEIDKWKEISKPEKIDSIFPLYEDLEYDFYLFENSKNRLIIPPRIINVNLLYEYSIPRIPKLYLDMVEFFNGYCKIKNFPEKYPFEIIQYEDKIIVMW